MKMIPLTSGPFDEWPWYELAEIESEATGLLRSHAHLPARPGEVDVASLVQAVFGFAPIYAALAEDILGFVDFGPQRVENIFIREELAVIGDLANEQHCRSTIAHEVGHGWLHAPYFCELKARQAQGNHFRNWGEHREMLPQLVFRHGSTAQMPMVSRAETLDEGASAFYSKRNYGEMPEHVRLAEWQANRFMVALQVPVPLVRMLVHEMIEVREDGYSTPEILPKQREWVVGEVSRTFNVSRKLSRSRLSELYPASSRPQDLFQARTLDGGVG